MHSVGSAKLTDVIGVLPCIAIAKVRMAAFWMLESPETFGRETGRFGACSSRIVVGIHDRRPRQSSLLVLWASNVRMLAPPTSSARAAMMP